MGLLALGVLLWFCIALLVSGARTYFGAPDGPEKLVVLAIITSFAGLLVWVIFEAHLMRTGSMTTLGLLVGIVAVVGSRRLVWKSADS